MKFLPDPLPDLIPRRSQVFWRRGLYGLLGALALGLILYALRPQPLVVDLATVARGDFQVTINAEGKTRVRDRYGVTAPVTGDLQRLSLQVGDRVRAGDTIAQIDPLPLNNQVKAAQGRLRSAQAELAGVNSQRPKPAAVAQAQARIEAAQATQAQAQARVEEAAAALAQAQREGNRLTTLYRQGGVARQQLEVQQLAATQAQQQLTMARQQVTATAAEVEAARAARRLMIAEQRDPDYLMGVYQGQIAAIEAELVSLADAARRTTVTAPAAGQVLTVIEPNRRYVTAGTPLLSLGNPKNLELVIDILSTDAVQVRPGARVIVNRWGATNP
jgi:HlyD family secretion protein